MLKLRLNNLDRLSNDLWNIFDNRSELLYNDSNVSFADCEETKEGYEYELNLAGFGKNNIEVSVEGGFLKVKAQQGERSITKNLPLPEKADPSTALAKYEDGILYLKLNKYAKEKPQTIKIT